MDPKINVQTPRDAHAVERLRYARVTAYDGLISQMNPVHPSLPPSVSALRVSLRREGLLMAMILSSD